MNLKFMMFMNKGNGGFRSQERIYSNEGDMKF